MREKPGSYFRGMERLCREQAALCHIKESRVGLEKLAANYRLAAEAEEVKPQPHFQTHDAQ